MHTDAPTVPEGSTPGGRERRRHPRATLEWPITIALSEGEHEARLRDVSASGLCFFLDRAIPEMTVLALRFELPGSARDAGGADAAGTLLECNGAVVRCERISPTLDHYEVAVFFHDVSDSSRRALEAYVATPA